MCQPKDINALVAKPKTPRSPWRRLRQQIKPRLSRKVVPGSKVNLNHFWSKFEDHSNQQLPIMTLTENVNNNAMLIQDNEINDNLLNELTEMGK